ncbi:MAG: right-handed parallel beta-helix repeat-containing protein [Bdellovibrionales bacterium]
MRTKFAVKKISPIFFVSASAILVLALFQNCSAPFDAAKMSELTSASLAAPPVISFSEDIPAMVTGSMVSARFDITGSVRSVSCQLNNQAEEDCSTRSVAYGNLADGDYSFVVTAVSSFGVSSTQRRTFRKDTVGPVITTSMAPAAMSGSASASFIFTVTDNLSGVAAIECSLDNATFANCVSPVNLAGLNAGAHNFRIQARDQAGHTSAIYSHNWTVDLTVPSVTISAQPVAVTNLLTASFSFAGTGIVSYQCSLDNAAFAACSSPINYNALAAGAHNFRVQGTNGFGLTSAPTAYSWTVDNILPSTPTVVSSVGASTNLRQVSFNFSSTDVSGVASYQCSLNNAAFAACTSPRAFTGLLDGSHNFRVQAIDVAGNVSAIATFLWLIDGTGPALSFTQAPANSTSTSATIAFSASDAGSGLAQVQCSLDNAALANCTSPVNLTNLSVANHTYQVQARDNAGNLSRITHNWAVVANNPPPPPPPSGTGPSYYFSDCRAGAAADCVQGSNANAGTSVSAPKQNLNGFDVDALPAGSSLLFARGGVWDNFRVQIVNLNATPTQPITFDAYGTGPLPWLRVVNGTGFEFGSFGDTNVDGGYVVRNLRLQGTETLPPSPTEWGIWLRDDLVSVTIENVEVTSFHIGIHITPSDRQGINNLIIRNNLINRNTVQGILGKANNLLIEGNMIRDNNQDGGGFEHGIYMSGGHDVIVRNNIFRNNSAPNGVCTGGNMTLHGQMENWLIEGNRIDQVAAGGGCYGFSITTGYSSAEWFRNFTVRNNTVVNVGNCGICAGSAQGIVVENNRIINNQNTFQIGIHIPTGTPGPGDDANGPATVRNNRICQANPSPGSEAVRAPAGSTVENNTYVTGAAALQGDCAP